MPADGFRAPIELRGRHVELLPLLREHRQALLFAARDPEVGRFLRTQPGTTLASIDGLIGQWLEGFARGTVLPFSLRVPGGPVIGMTNYLRIERANRAVEIGGTWLDSTFWRTPVNTEAKYLLLRHAFEDEQFHRVQLQTDSRNVRSQRAIARIGGVHEAALREDVLLSGPYWRTSEMFSLLAPEWPSAKARLESMLARLWVGPERGPA
jgi:RimJ/RimL family protein N-acetyltransferase